MTPADTRPGNSRFGSAREQFSNFIELFALTGLLVAQPVLNFLGNGSRYMVVSYRLSTRDFVIFSLLVLFVPAVAAWVVEVIAGAVWPAGRGRVHAVLCGLLFGAIVANFVKVSTPLPAAVYLLIAAGAAVLAFRLVLRYVAARQWLRFLSVAPVVFAMLFVTASPASVLLSDGAAHPAKVTIAHPARVVMIVLDEFQEASLLDGTGHIDAALFPNFARLANTSNWYRNDSTVAEYTLHAVPAILTGQLPPLNAPMPTASKYPKSIFTLLGNTYHLNVHETAESVCPDVLCGSLKVGNALSDLTHDGLQVMRNLMDLRKYSWEHHVGFRLGIERGNEFHAFSEAQAFIKSIQPSSVPTLDYLHLLMPHQPWRYLSGGRDTGAPAVPLDYLFSKPANSPRAALGREMYLLQLQATDWLLGQTIDRLQSIGAWNNSLFVLTADHGVTFPFQRYATAQNFMQILWTPLFIKAPNQGPGVIDDRAALSIDVLPTMADILGVKIPWKVSGRSLLGTPHVDGPRPFMHNDAGLGIQTTFNGPAGSAQLLRARAAPPGGDPKLRIYRFGFYGGLVGQKVAKYMTNAGQHPTGTLTSPGGVDHVVPDARVVPWTRVDGTIRGPGVAVGETIAIAVNERIAGLAVVDELSQYHGLLAPELFAPGHNDVVAYLASGPPLSPKLIAVAPPVPPLGGKP